jgi:protein-S-isoprenylcysteine O-methyltransferase Ste14
VKFPSHPFKGEIQMKIKTNASIVIIITAAVSIIAALAISLFSYFSIIAAITVFLFVLGELAIIYFMRRKALYRKQNLFSVISIALIGVVFIVSFIDLNFGSYNLPAWCSWLGLILFFSGNYLLISSLIAHPRHGREEYGEEQNPDNQSISIHGPYDVVRHPINLAAFLMAFSLPLILGSAWAFIASGVAAVFIIVQAVSIENYRFEHYSWYYDYTKKVPFMMIPVIW